MLLVLDHILAKDLRGNQLKSGVLLQYIEDLLLSNNAYEYCLLNTIIVLNHLAKTRYKY